MLTDCDDLDFAIVVEVISDWVVYEFKNDFQKKLKSKRVRRQFKKDMWNSAWGELITHVDVRDPSSYEGLIFKYRLIIPFGLFMV